VAEQHGDAEVLTSGSSRFKRRPFDVPRTWARGRSTPLWWAAVTSLVVAAGALWLARAGSSSLFTDEAVSWLEGRSRLQLMLALNRRDEVNPLGYPLLLHEWLRLGLGSSEWWLRLPSVLAAIALMVALVWLTWLVAGRKAALLAALLGAVSPFMFSYAQMARAYMFVMLAVTIAVAGVLQAERSHRSARGWLALSALAGAGAQCLHYTAWCILLPLGLYVATRSAFSRRARVAWSSAVAVAGVAWTPLLVEQMHAGHTGFLASMGNLAPEHVGDVFGDVFSSRVLPPTSLALLGAGMVVAAALVCLLARRRQAYLIAALAIAAPLALLLATLAGHPSLLIRYAGVSVPFMLVSLAVAVMMLPMPAAAAAGIGVLAFSLWNVRAADQPLAQNQNFRGGLAYVAAHHRPGDVVVALGSERAVFDLDYYIPRLLPRVRVIELPPAQPPVVLSMAPVQAATRAHKTIWFVNCSFPRIPTPHPSGYVVTANRLFIDIPWLKVVRFSIPRARNPSP
jgi:mannosyltransferase